MITAFKQVYNKLEGLGHKPKLNMLKNECSRCIQTFLEKKGTKLHHVAPQNNCVNAAKSAVKTAKYHLIAALATLDWSSQIEVWSKMVRQLLCAALQHWARCQLRAAPLSPTEILHSSNARIQMQRDVPPLPAALPHA